MSERDDVLVIRVTRPAGLDFEAGNRDEAEAKGDRYALLQDVAVETSDGFTEELIAAWDAVGIVARDVQAGRRMLGGNVWPPEPSGASAPAEEERNGQRAT